MKEIYVGKRGMLEQTWDYKGELGCEHMKPIDLG